MYCKLFASLYQGTLRGKSHEILVFTNLLATCDKDGHVDKHWRAIAEEVGLTIEEVKAAISSLESPDTESRSPEHEGRRLVKMDEHREWGWQIVNYLKYRLIRDADDRKEQNRKSQENYRNKNKQSKPESAEVSLDKPQSANAEVEGEVKEKKSPSLKKTFTDKWCSAWKEFHGESYSFRGVQDGAAADRLLKVEPDIEKLIAIARKAWALNGKHEFEKGHAIQLSSFVSQFNKIRLAVGSLDAKPKITPEGYEMSSKSSFGGGK